MRRRGLTLVEVLTCLAIAAVLAAVLLPVLGEAKASSRRSVTASNFHQIYAALSLYRNEYGGDGFYGEASRMGLPTDMDILAKSQKLPKTLFRSGCPSIRAPFMREALFRQMWHTDGDPTMEEWTPYTKRYQGASILVGDDNCDFRDQHYANPMASHRAIGLYEAGNVRTIVKVGSTSPYEWWNQQENP